MDQLSYFKNRSHIDTIKYYVYLYFVIIKKNDKYWICNEMGGSDHKGILRPLGIEGEIIGLYTTLNTFAYICTDKNTYFYINNCVTPCNCICTNAVVSRHCVILTTSRGKLFCDYSTSYDSTMNFHQNPKIISNLMILGSNWRGCNVSLNYSFATYPDEVYTFSTAAGEVWIVGLNKKYSLIHRGVLCDIDYSGINIARLIVDYGPNTLFSSQTAYFISATTTTTTSTTANVNVYTISKDPMTTLAVLCTTNITDPWSIKEIVSFRNYCVIVGKDYLHVYPKLNNGQSNELAAAYMTVEPNSVSVYSGIWSNLILNYKSGFIIIGSKLTINNPGIQYTLMDEFKLHGIQAYLMMPAPNTKLYSSYGSFMCVNTDNIATGLRGNPIWSSVKSPSSIQRKLENIEIQIELNGNAFDQLLYTLISTNFNAVLHVIVTDKSIVQSEGPGPRRAIHNAVVEYMRSNLFIVDTDNALTTTSKINISHPFWLQNNGYYMGKLIAYLFNLTYTLPFHIGLNRLYAIYEQIQSRIKSDKINVDSLAPFHKEFYPLDFVCMTNLDNAYKLDDEKFKQLALGYDSFLECIKNRLHMGPIPAEEVPILSSMAVGLYDFNPKIAILSLWELAKFMSGDFLYNRFAVINNINFYIDDEKFEPYRIMMKAFVDGLTDDELMQFMIIVTGYHVRNSPVSVTIIETKSGCQDVLIATCYDKLSVACHVFEQKGYEGVLKGYLCVRDKYITR
jgi:hypothetical protein